MTHWEPARRADSSRARSSRGGNLPTTPAGEPTPARILLGLAACLAFAGSAPGATARTWQAPQPLGEGEQTFLVQAVAAGLGETVSVYQRVGPDGSEIVARSAGFGMGFGREQVLGEARSFYPTAAADALGETFAAWYDEMDSTIRVAIGPPGGEFGPPLVLGSSGSDYSQGAPHLAASPTGAAVVAFLIRDASGQRMLASVRRRAARSAQPRRSPRRPAARRSRATSRSTTSARSSPAPYQQDGIALGGELRTPGALGTWQPPQALGARNNGWSWSAPQVGIDATGGAIAIWQEGAGLNDVGPLRAAFRAPLGRFGAPQTFGIVGPDSERGARRQRARRGDPRRPAGREDHQRGRATAARRRLRLDRARPASAPRERSATAGGRRTR